MLPYQKPAFAVRARFDAYYSCWFLENLIVGANGEPKWVRRIERRPDGGYKAATFGRDNAAGVEARKAARTLSRELSPGADLDKLRENDGSSLSLKLSKALISSQRRQDEEALMLAEARKRNTHLVAPPKEALLVPARFEEERDELHMQLQEFPYLQTAVVGKGVRRTAIGTSDGLTWRRLHNGYLSRRTAEIAHRARISEGFGISPLQHWGKTKAAIRAILLPRAIQLLQLEPMKRLLAQALAEGRRAVVLDRFVFWYEEEGGIGWTVKEVGTAKGERDEPAEWLAGTIISKNFGRIVVLPFIKNNGERVSGYTRNGPGDGPAKPRVPGEHKEIPFTRLEGDTVIGLLGELPYGP